MQACFPLPLALLVGALPASLAVLKPSRVGITLGPNFAFEIPLIAVVVTAFLAGALLVLLVIVLRDLGRALRNLGLAHRAARAEHLADLYHRGLDAQLTGRTEDAVEAYQEVLRREPGHAAAHLRLGELARDQGNHQAALSHDLQALGSAERADILFTVAADYQRLGRVEDALATYRRLVQHERDHAGALRALRELTVSARRWEEALEVQERLLSLASAEERPRELEWLAGIHYEIGKGRVTEGRLEEARRHFTEALKADRAFVPAHLALGDASARVGDRREAIRAWKRAAEVVAAPELLRRLEQAYRDEGRPTLMIAVYQEALERSPQDLALAFALGRVYFELEMLDEAADQFQKVEVYSPDLAPLHAFLGAIYERRGQAAAAFEEYRRALRLIQSFDWPYRCAACRAVHSRWQDRCSLCGRWNTSTA